LPTKSLISSRSNSSENNKRAKIVETNNGEIMAAGVIGVAEVVAEGAEAEEEAAAGLEYQFRGKHNNSEATLSHPFNGSSNAICWKL
jgi:hypothetical protein